MSAPTIENASAAGTARGADGAVFGGLRLNSTTPTHTPRVFEFEAITPVRVVVLGGEPWFVGRDVADALGYADPTTAIRAHCKGVLKQHPLETAGGVQNFRILSEPDVLRLIVKSSLPEAERFEQWIFEEVLPTVRRTGGYGQPIVPENFAAALRLAADQAERIAAQAVQIEQQRPAVAFVEWYVNASGTVSLREAGKILNIPQNRFIGWLEDEGILFRQSGRLMPTAEFQKRGYFSVKTGQANEREFSQTRFTAVGLEWIARRWAKRDGADGVSS